jgi:hypothetical protein
MWYLIGQEEEVPLLNIGKEFAIWPATIFNLAYC